MLSARGYRSLLRDACKKAQADGKTLIEILDGIRSGAYAPAMDGNGLMDVTSTSSAGHSVTLGDGAGSPGRTDVGDAAELLQTIAEGCLEVNPQATGPELCQCVMGQLPLRDVRSFGARFSQMAAGS